jgi:hypothetical protein
MVMKMGKPTTQQRRAFVMSLRDSGLSYEQIAAEAIKQFGKENLPKGYCKRLAQLDVSREPNKKIPDKLKTEIRRNKILQYRLGGMSYQQILQKLQAELGAKNLPHGYCERHVCLDLKRYLNKIETQNRQQRIETKILCRERLDSLLNVLWEKALQGDLQAIDRALEINKDLLKLDCTDNISRSIAAPPERNLNSFADISEHFSKLNRKGNSNGNDKS